MRGKIVDAVRIGIVSVKTNAIPMVSLWALAGALVWSYYRLPCIRGWLEPLAIWQRDGGWMAAFLNRFVFCGVVPGVFLLTVRAIRPRRPLLTALAQGVWGGLSGIVFDFFYRLQGAVFGCGTDLITLVKKMLVDQFVLTPFIVAPLNVFVFFWIAHDFSFRRSRAEFPRPFVMRALMPNLLTNWCVWIPVVMAIYAFPPSLQIQVSGFACAFWALTCLQIGRRSSSSRRAS